MQIRRLHLIQYGRVLLLLVFLAQAALTARQTSITLDEPLHIASGYACLLTGDFRLVEEHPPLLKMLQAAPLLQLDPPLPPPQTVPGWSTGNLVEFAQHSIVSYRPIDPLVFAARVPTMLVGVLLGALIYRWASDLSGRRSYLPLLALGMFAFDPNMLAHAAVAATDLGAAAGIFAAAYYFWRWIHEPTATRAGVAAFALGLALGTKNTALVLGPTFAAALLWSTFHKRVPQATLLQGAGIAIGAFVTLWGIYGFEFGPTPGLAFPIPAPSHALPLLKLRTHMREGHSAFLMGENYHHGDWRYFPIAFLLKTPPLTLSLTIYWLLWTAYRLLRGADKRQIGAGAYGLIGGFPLLYFAVSLSSGINIGYRHLLPILPFIYVAVTAPLSHLPLQGSRPLRYASRVVALAVLFSYMTTTLALSPWHLAYFNFFAGGPDDGYRYLVDSNLDWGQTWKELRLYLDTEGITEFYLSNYTINDPHAYGLDYTPLPPWPEAPPVLPQRFDPPPGIYAISTTQLQGVVTADPEMFDYFRNLEPTARIGHAMYVYNLAAKLPAQWVAQCSTPVAPLPADQLREGLGIADDVPILSFDCNQSWIIPPGEGRYVLSREYTGAPWPLLEQARLAYAQKRTGLVPPFNLYEWNVDTYPGPSSWTVPAATVGDVLSFLGFSASPIRAGEMGVVQTWWRVKARPAMSLSLMAHLLNTQGVPIAVGDGLGVSVDQWVPGSLLIQRHLLTIPSEASPGFHSFQVGAYSYPGLERLSVTVSGQPPRDHFVAGVLEIVAP